MKKTILLLAYLSCFIIKHNAQTVTDIDGNVYSTVTIGSQVWMAENLRVAHFNNGDPIPNVTDSLAWDNLTTGAFCWYNNDSVMYDSLYGKLYNWYAVHDSRKIAPEGWHVPSYPELTTLANYLGGENIAGGKLKEAGTTHWNSPNTGATNETGFTALPAGARDEGGAFNGIELWGILSSTTSSGSNNAWHRGMDYDASKLNPGTGPMKYGFSVRCLRDFPTQTNKIKDREQIQIYPNPAGDRIHITCSDKQDVKMQVYNLVGECIRQEYLKSAINSIDISSLLKGIYIMKFTGSNLTVQRKLIKE